MALDQSPEIDYDDDDEEEKKDTGNEMTFIEHLEALRWHLIRAVSAILVFMIGAWFIKGFIFKTIILGPSNPDFWTYRMMCKIGTLSGVRSLCVDTMNFELMSRQVSGQFMMALTTSAIVGLVMAFPYIFWEIWRFVKPGLKITEKKASRGAVFFVTFLFFCGITFGYFIVAPFAINFLVNFQLDESIKNQFDIGNYIGILSTLVLACGVVFQLPAAMLVLTKVGVVTPKFLRDYRKHSIVVLLIVAAIITPSPDMISQILVAIPLYILYEISIKVSEREIKRQKRQAILDEEED
ncbi:MAG: sec-independent protein translocase protein TatC [Algoriphagus sp.]|jgi:sec-independent protein translocase protein TatC